MATTGDVDGNDYANSTLSFPQKLFILLETDTSGLISWVSHGMCFRIEDSDKFADDIVPRYFKQTKLTSFQRQLNLYGFRRISKGEDQGCYFHPKFQRHRKDLLAEIKRLPVKGSLQTYDQVMAAVHSLPSERFGSKRKQTATPTVKEEEPVQKKQAVEAQASTSTSNAPVTLAANSPSESNLYYPRMSKLTMNIGFGKFLENQKMSAINKPVPPPRAEHLLRSHVQRQQQEKTNIHSFAPVIEQQRDLINFPMFSNFACEKDDASLKQFAKKPSEVSLLSPDELDLLDFLEPIKYDADGNDEFAEEGDTDNCNDEEYIPSFEEAILHNRIQ